MNWFQVFSLRAFHAFFQVAILFSSIKPALSTRIGRRFLYHILWLSFAISLVIFCTPLINDYKKGTAQIRASLEQIEEGYRPSMSDSAWTFDKSQLITQLHSILNFEGVTQVSVVAEEMETLSVGNPSLPVDLSYQFSLRHPNAAGDVEIGRVYIKVSYDSVVQELKNKALSIMLIEFLKTLTISLSLVLVFHQLVTRHLQDLANWAERMNLSSLDEFPRLKRDKQVDDELSSLADAITRMCETLLSETEKQKQVQREIEDARNQLSLAVENASIGFCRYIASEKKIIPNGHFCRQLRISETQLKALEDPLQELMNRMEETINSEQKERIRQLLQGRIQRVQGNIHLTNFNDQAAVFHITFQSISYRDYRPDELLICCLDKTAEYNAEQLNRELSISIESRIREGTDHLESELNIKQANLKRVQRELEKADLILNNQYRDSLMLLLSNNIRESFASAQQQQIPDHLMANTARCLELVAQSENHAIDLVHLTQRQIEQQLQPQALTPSQISTDLPFTLVINEPIGLLEFLLQQILGHLKTSLHQSPDHQLKISMRLKETTLQFRIESNFSQQSSTNPERENSLAMCQLLLAAEMNGTLEVHRASDGIQEILAISLPLDSI